MRLSVAIPLLLWACAPQGEPAPLPPPAVPDPTGRMVQAPGLRGFLVHPADRAAPAPGVVLLVDAIDDTSRSAAVAEARAPAVVLVVEADTATARAEAYLGNLAPVSGTPQVRCERAGGCP